MFTHIRFLGFTDFGFWMPLFMSIAIVYMCRAQFVPLLRSSFFYGMLLLTFLVSVLSDFCFSDPFSYGYEACDTLSFIVPLLYFLLVNHGKLHGTSYSAHSNKLCMSPWMVFPLVYIGTLFADFMAITSMPAAGYEVGTTNLFADILQIIMAGKYHFLSAQYAIKWIGGAGLEDGLILISMGATVCAFGLVWLMRRNSWVVFQRIIMGITCGDV